MPGASTIVLVCFILCEDAKKQVKKDKLKSKWAKCVANVLKKKRVQQLHPGCRNRWWWSRNLQALDTLA